MTLVPLKPSPDQRKRRGEQSTNGSRTSRMFRSVGYALLLLSMLDWVILIGPLQLMNPAWEFQTIGALVERVPVPLIALALIFFGEVQQRYRWEMTLTKLLSWFSFLLGLLFLVMLPLGLVNASRLNDQNEAQLTTAYQQRLEQIQQFEAQVGEADDATIVRFLREQGLATAQVTPKDVRNQAATELSKMRQKVYAEIEAEKAKRQKVLLKNTVKWTIGATISGFTFLYLWRLSRWARSRRSHSS